VIGGGTNEHLVSDVLEYERVYDGYSFGEENAIRKIVLAFAQVEWQL